MTKHFIAVTAFAALSLACGPKSGSGGGSDGGSAAEPAPTAIGQATGATVSAKMGTAGGTLISADGLVELIVPSGALSQDLDLTLTPASNEAPLGVGYTVRMGPDGTTFAKPVSLVFHYEKLATGTVPELLFGAFQDSNKMWQSTGAPVIDTTAKTATVLLEHFSDWTLSTCARLEVDRYVLAAPTDEATVHLIEQCGEPGTGLIGRTQLTPHPVTWSASDMLGKAVTSGLTASGSTAKIKAGTISAGDPRLKVKAQWQSPAGTRVLSDDIATSTLLSVAIDGQSYIMTTAFVQTLGGKSAVNGTGPAGGVSVGAPVTGVGGASSDPQNGIVVSVQLMNPDRTYLDSYILPCSSDIKWLRTTVGIGHANKERQYITGTFDGTLAISRGETTCNMMTVGKHDEVSVTGAFYAIWQNFN
jgi:hypothetical protein